MGLAETYLEKVKNKGPIRLSAGLPIIDLK